MAERRDVDITMPGMHGRRGGPGGGANRFMPTEKAKDRRGTFRKLLRYYLKEGRVLFLVSGLLIVQTGLSVAAPYLIGRSVDAMSGQAALDAVRFFVLVLIGAYIVGWLIDVTQGVLMNSASQRIVRSLRKSLFDKLQTLPLTYHDARSHGELMSRLTNDVDNISQTIAQSTTQLVSAAITIFGSMTVMLILSPIMTLAVLVTVPLVSLLTFVVATKSRKLFVAQQRELGKLNGIIEETITGQKIVKAFNMESAVISSFTDVNVQLRKAGTGALIWSGLLMPMMNVITNLGFLTVAVVGGYLAATDQITVGVIATFIAYSRQFTMPLNNLAGMFNNLQSALAGAERVFEVLAENDETADLADAVEMSVPKGDVRFEDVTFAYKPGQDVLHNVSFEAQVGKRIALVGETGAGKTTVVNLLSRFYDVTGGAVYIDGVDIRMYKRDSLRRAFSVVLQDTCLFSGSVADNIRYGRPDASMDEVIEAAKVGGAHEFIVRLHDGYDTHVSGGSESLSQGQRQLLAISRAMLCRAPILILDEATSSVDTRTELRIQQAMVRLVEGCTSFIIAHRLSTIRDADLILVMANGQIIERGTHHQLLEQDGHYAKMYRSSVL
ncbi:MAG: ABC transporter ATP-binding protein/permease [Oscillospiraceae bacterium]|nr:ABC transporter ATP-binding protein/permease [Oscillospiraceae bacterium]